MIKLTIRIGKKDLSDFERGISVGAKQASLLGFLHITISKVYRGTKQIPSE